MNQLIKLSTFLVFFCLVAMGCQNEDTVVITKSVENRIFSEAEKMQLEKLEQLIQERVVENNIPSLSVTKFLLIKISERLKEEASKK